MKYIKYMKYKIHKIYIKYMKYIKYLRYIRLNITLQNSALEKRNAIGPCINIHQTSKRNGGFPFLFFSFLFLSISKNGYNY